MAFTVRLIHVPRRAGQWHQAWFATAINALQVLFETLRELVVATGSVNPESPVGDIIIFNFHASIL